MRGYHQKYHQDSAKKVCSALEFTYKIRRRQPFVRLLPMPTAHLLQNHSLTTTLTTASSSPLSPLSTHTTPAPFVAIPPHRWAKCSFLYPYIPACNPSHPTCEFLSLFPTPFSSALNFGLNISKISKHPTHASKAWWHKDFLKAGHTSNYEHLPISLP